MAELVAACPPLTRVIKRTKSTKLCPCPSLRIVLRGRLLLSLPYRHMVEQDKFYGGEGGILGAMEKHSLHLLMAPSSLGIANDLAAKMGFPVLGVPLGFYPEGTPVELDDCKPHLVWVAPGIPYSPTFDLQALFGWLPCPRASQKW